MKNLSELKESLNTILENELPQRAKSTAYRDLTSKDLRVKADAGDKEAQAELDYRRANVKRQQGGLAADNIK